MSGRRKHRAGSDSGTVAIVFIGILTYGFLTNHALLNRVEVVTKYALALGVAAIVVTLAIRLAKRLLDIKRRKSLAAVDIMTGVEFEHYVAKLLVKQGYSHISLTERYDYGVDIIAEKDGVRWGIQVKRNKGLVKAVAVRQVVTALKKYGCDRAMVVSNSQFSHIAIELAKANDCRLIGRNTLVSWISA